MMKRPVIWILIMLMLVSIVGMSTGCKKAEEPGKVYFLNFKPEADEEWQRLAWEYTEQTGVEVRVRTVQAGAYASTLEEEMGKEEKPTLFQCSGKQDMEKWLPYALDLTDTKVHQNCVSDEYNLKDDKGHVWAIGYCYEVFGIIVNVKLLAQAGYVPEDIQSFEDLKAVAESITARFDELGFHAFTSAGLDGVSSWRFSGHLANIPLYYEFRDGEITQQPAEITGEYLYGFKNLWDLYIQNSPTLPNQLSSQNGFQARDEFMAGKAVFYQNGSWEYADLVALEEIKKKDLTMIPMYCGIPGEENAGLSMGTENYWMVNSKASKADQEATLAFLDWVTSSGSGMRMLNNLFGGVPFREANTPYNVFFEAAAVMQEEKKYFLTWEFVKTPNAPQWRKDLVGALVEYSAGRAEWSAVEEAFVDGWAEQYKNQ